ncbi:hypothetical protein A3H26_01085 [candidate division WWE3 bacterium RIFCSPLOWO2_12_FULL_36_10]|uniref:DUF3566 domain-containing protein n=1 Tax=candidate division WWE3 bacterium RIFCSPLOWO2_12_FULL_36_10 TaxID=1802630 RepID=A0A1F4VH08_UNCKA|nr:MAG: hypothetical protein A3H26_01085 [candidate division WWE3 bacterium RIFCSPLOWO2_12_FULL_36_10]
MKVLKKVDILSFALFYSVLMGMFGVIAGIFVGVYGLIASQLGTLTSQITDSSSLTDLVGPPVVSGPEMGSGFGLGLGLFSIILFPIFYAVLGFTFGIIGGLLMNLALKITRGLKLQIEDVV